jgi:co-chaperonin GroES (HSP10)
MNKTQDINKINPLWDNILIEIAEPIVELESGILLPMTSKEAAIRNQGTILKVGKDVKQVKIGDKVSFPINIGTSFEFNNKQYKIAKEVGLHCIVG